jgi:hypothetical protein
VGPTLEILDEVQQSQIQRIHWKTAPDLGKNAHLSEPLEEALEECNKNISDRIYGLLFVSDWVDSLIVPGELLGSHIEHHWRLCS